MLSSARAALSTALVAKCLTEGNQTLPQQHVHKQQPVFFNTTTAVHHGWIGVLADH
jgi:hypothetical protein